MKLYLSSYGLGNHPEELQALVGDNRLAAVIVNAQDGADIETRQSKVADGLAEMTGLGFEAEELDLRKYFGNSSGLAAELGRFGLLWVRGGNSFVLRRAMRMSGFDTVIPELVASEQLIYAGYSAGSCVTGQTLRGIELCDDPLVVPAGYDSEIIWEGLGLVSYSIAPHYRSEHFESEAVEQVVEYFQEKAMDFVALQDGQAIVVNGDYQHVTDKNE